jgi:hypothetical protein
VGRCRTARRCVACGGHDDHQPVREMPANLTPSGLKSSDVISTYEKARQ